MRRLLALGVHAAILIAVFEHRPRRSRTQAEDGALYAALVGAPGQGARADWKYTTALLALDRPLYRPLQEDAPEADEWGHVRWAEAAARAEELGDLDLALGVRERYRPRRRCGLDTAPENAARAYADLCYRMGRWACFLNLRVRLMGEDLIEGTDSTWAERMRKVGIDVERFLRGLLYQFPAPGLERSEVEPRQLAGAMREAGLATSMATWLALEATRRDLDEFNRSRAAQTLAFLRKQAAR